MPSENCFARVLRLCDEDRIIDRARERTRLWLSGRDGGLDDGALQHALQVHACCDGAPAEDRALVHELREEAERLLRERLVIRLVDHDDLLGVAARAAAGAGIPERAQQIAYCLVVLCQKHDPSRKPFRGGPKTRTFGLDVGSDGFAERLATWAATLTRNLRADGGTYEAIRAEAQAFRWTTARRLVRPAAHEDDIAAAFVAEKLLPPLLRGLALEDMTLGRAAADGPVGDEFVFQGPLGRWIATSWHRYRPPAPDPFAEVGEIPDEPEPDSATWRADVLAGLMAAVRELSQTRDTLSSAISAIDDLLRRADQIRLDAPEQADIWNVYRAELAHVADGLRRERGHMGSMLTYILVALRAAPKRQDVAILSMRSDSLRADVVAHIAAQMRAIVVKGAPLVPGLVGRAHAAPREVVPRGRVVELVRARDHDRHRRAALAQLSRLLDEMPAAVGDLAAIGGAVRGTMTARSVAVTRGQVSAELRAVDPIFERVFRRYAMRFR
jgi:hypothetical protein